MLPPPVATTHQPDRAVELSLQLPASSRCQVQQGAFSLDRPAGAPGWRLRLPSLSDFEKAVFSGFVLTPVRTGAKSGPQVEVRATEAVNAPGERLAGDLLQFLHRIEGCLPAASAHRVTEAVLDNLPARSAETLAWRYRYRLGEGILDLSPGVRLKLQRAVFTPKYAGTHTAVYVLAARGRRLGFERASIDTTVPNPAKGWEREMAMPARPAYYFRLFLLNDFVRRNLVRVGMVAGADTRGQLDGWTASLREQPDQACPPSLPACVAIDGRATISAELDVEVDGKITTVPVGATLQRLQAAAGNCSGPSLLRRYGSAHLPVTNAASAPGDVVLLPGDRIQCAPPAASMSGTARPERTF